MSKEVQKAYARFFSRIGGRINMKGNFVPFKKKGFGNENSRDRKESHNNE
jgi:hypothetical protein